MIGFMRRLKLIWEAMVPLIRRLKRAEARCEMLEEELNRVKKILEEQQLASFIWVKNYRLGEPIQVSEPTPVISIRGLEARVNRLESSS